MDKMTKYICAITGNESTQKSSYGLFENKNL